MPDISASHTILVAIGSNHSTADALIEKAQQLMSSYITDLRTTETLTTEPIGIISEPFRNCLVMGRTVLDAASLVAALKKTERDCGDRRSLRRENVIMMDIDLLLHDTQRYHLQDWSKCYIQQLLPQTDIKFPPKT